MNKYLKFSTLILLGGLFVTISSVNAAPSVRSFGGAGTYNSSAGATTAKTNSAINSVRAGSVNRVGGTAAKTGGTVSSANTARAASNPQTRLSSGRLILGGQSISGGFKPQGPAPTPGTGGDVDLTEVHDKIDGLDGRVTDLEAIDPYTKPEVDDLLDAKQNFLTPGENVTIENNVISINLDDIGNVIVDLTPYSTTVEMEQAIADAIIDASANYATAAQGATADTALQAGDVYTNAEVDKKIDDLGALAAKDTVATVDITDKNVTIEKLADEVNASFLQTVDYEVVY